MTYDAALLPCPGSSPGTKHEPMYGENARGEGEGAEILAARPDDADSSGAYARC
jgi:hypothetical protein